MLELAPVILNGMILDSDTTVSLIVFGYGIATSAIIGLIRLSAKYTRFQIEHEALKSQTRENSASIIAVTGALEEVRTMMREERHQMGRMSSKIDMLISVLVNRKDAALDLEQVMTILEKGDHK